MAWGSALRGAGAFCGRSVVLNQCLLVVARLDQCAYPPKTSRAAAHSPTQNNRGSVISGGCSRRSLTSIKQLMIHSRAGKGLMRRVAGGAAAHAVGRPPQAPHGLSCGACKVRSRVSTGVSTPRERCQAARQRLARGVRLAPGRRAAWSGRSFGASIAPLMSTGAKICGVRGLKGWSATIYLGCAPAAPLPRFAPGSRWSLAIDT